MMNRDKWNDYYFAALCALAFIIPLSQFLSVRLLVVLSAGFFVFPGIGARTLTLFRNAWGMFVYILVLLAGLLYSTDMVNGLKTLETSFSLIALPLVFSTVRDFDESKLNTVFKYFAFGLAVACIICLSFAFSNYFKTNDVGVFFFEQLTESLSSQPTYFAYYLIFSIGYGLYVIFYNSMPLNRYLLLTIIVLFFLVLMLTGGRTTFVSLLLIFSFFVLKFLLEAKDPRKNMVFTSVIVMLVVLFAANYISPVSTYLSANNDYWERSVLWRSAIDANNNPLLGVGTGDYKIVLNDYFIANGLAGFAAENYNSHNQFIQNYLSNGGLGLLALLLLIGRPLYLAIRNYDTLGMITIFPFFIYGLTEVFLGRYQGVVFFGLLHQLTVVRNTMPTANAVLKVGKFE